MGEGKELKGHIAAIIIAILAIALSWARSFPTLEFVAIFLISSFISVVSGFRMRYLIHGSGWYLPNTTQFLLLGAIVDVGLYLYFSR